MVTGSSIARCGEVHVSFRYPERTGASSCRRRNLQSVCRSRCRLCRQQCLAQDVANCSAAARVIRKLPTASIWFSLSVFETASLKISASVTGSTGPRNPAVGTASKYTTGAEQALRYWHD
jgi:hypothetical protein